VIGECLEQRQADTLNRLILPDRDSQTPGARACRSIKRQRQEGDRNSGRQKHWKGKDRKEPITGGRSIEQAKTERSLEQRDRQKHRTVRDIKEPRTEGQAAA
jgi:hypothetical protein